ncbi:MAG: hypothetical protein GY800_13385 [Planctomycetes bacterium]|nr:hypothetical protein [Planctomycetota bacterium]
MRTPLYAILAVLVSGCSMLGSSDTSARLDAMEQQMAVVIERIGTIEETNEEIMENVQELANNKSTDRRLNLMEEKQAAVEVTQLDLVSRQEVLKGSINKVREYVEALNGKIDKLASENKAGAAAMKRKRLEERLKRQVDEDVRIQEIPRDKIIKIEKPPPSEKLKEKDIPPPDKLIERDIPPQKKKEEIEVMQGGFILEDF